jgi:hypothetical protein
VGQVTGDQHDDLPIGALAGAELLLATFERDPRSPIPCERETRIGAAVWLRDRAVRAAQAASAMSVVFDAAGPLAQVVHQVACPATLAPECPALLSATTVVASDLANEPTVSNEELAAALSIDGDDTLRALSAVAVSLIVAVDGPGAGAVIGAMRQVPG